MSVNTNGEPSQGWIGAGGLPSDSAIEVQEINVSVLNGHLSVSGPAVIGMDYDTPAEEAAEPFDAGDY